MKRRRYHPEFQAQLRPVVEDAGEEAVVLGRHAARIRDETAGPFALLAERGHPLVRALLRHHGRGSRGLAVVCGALPLLTWAALLLVAAHAEEWWPAGPANPQSPLLAIVTAAAGGFAAIWPGVCFLGAAWRAAGTVIDERARNSALQLVLTPMPMRPIAASKILPAVWPFLLGALAAAPLLVWVGDSPAVMAVMEHEGGVFLLPSAVWPLRLFTLAAYEQWQLSLTPPGLIAGLFMALSDAALVWAAAHWGAAFAVRWNGRLIGVAFSLAWRTVLLAAVALGCWLASMPLVGIAMFFMEKTLQGEATLTVMLLRAALALLQAATMGFLLWFWPLRGATRRALREFSYFDRLADDEARPGRQRTITGRRWWEVNWRQ